MLIAHLPSGYLLGISINKLSTKFSFTYKSVTVAALAGSVVPDIDLVYFYTVDAKQHLHHTYWTHMPLFWCVLYIPMAVAMRCSKDSKAIILLSIAFAGVLLHLALDTLTGSINWLYPITSNGHALVTVPTVHKWWILNFLLHWTFLLEIGIAIIAFFVHTRRKMT